jgi:hypothetical protein
MNYLVYEGLKRYGYDEIAAELAMRTEHLAKVNWDTTGALWENYNSITGEGNAHGAGGSTKHYAWSATLPLIAIMECIDQEAWEDGLRFGSVGLLQQSRIDNFPIRGHQYSVSVGPDLTELTRDEIRLFTVHTSAVIRHFKWDPSHVTFKIKLNKSAHDDLITLRGMETGLATSTQVILDGKLKVVVQNSISGVVFNVPQGEHSVEVKVTEIPKKIRSKSPSLDTRAN